MSQSVPAAGGETSRFEPTVFGAIRRYSALVLVLAVVAMAVAVGYAVTRPKVYRSEAMLSVALPVSLQAEEADTAQYLDSQVLVLQSQGVAGQAARIANGTLHNHQLAAGNFSGKLSSLVITPPTSATPGAYGASLVAVSFTWPNARIARVGLNALLEAYDNARAATLTAQANSTVAGINQAINQTNAQLTAIGRQQPGPGASATVLQQERQLLVNQRETLGSQRTQALVNEQTDLAQTPTVAVTPATVINGNWARAGAIGFVAGLLLGVALAFVQASRRRGFSDRQDPSALYGAPLIAEIPAFDASKAKGLASPTGVLLPISTRPDSAAAEAFRFAAGFVERLRSAKGPRLTVACTSPLADGSKSIVVANLALAIAEGGTGVLVVAADGDLAARLLHSPATAGGLEQVLGGEQTLADCAPSSPLASNVSILRSGSGGPGRVAGVARSRAMTRLLVEARGTFDVVLIDCPAMLRVAGAAELVGAADSVIVIPGAKDLVRDHSELAELLTQIGSSVVGYVYNRVPTRYARRVAPAIAPAPAQIPEPTQTPEPARSPASAQSPAPAATAEAAPSPAPAPSPKSARSPGPAPLPEQAPTPAETTLTLRAPAAVGAQRPDGPSSALAEPPHD